MQRILINCNSIHSLLHIVKLHYVSFLIKLLLCCIVVYCFVVQ